jgi:hypothetical protein
MAFGFPTASHSAEVVLEVNRQTAREAINETLAVLDWSFDSPHPDFYKAKIFFSGWTWGEKLTVHFSDSGVIEVQSRCAPIPQLFDWGKNRANVERFIDLLTAKAERIAKMNSLTELRFDTSESTPLERVLADWSGE